MALILVALLASLAVEATALPYREFAYGNYESYQEPYAYDGYGGLKPKAGVDATQSRSEPYAYDGYGGLKPRLDLGDGVSRSEAAGGSGSCGRHFDYHPAEVNWDTARRRCEFNGGRLAVISALEGSNAFFARFADVTADGVWIGASDRGRPGHWMWDNGRREPREMSFTNWDRREPQHNSACLLQKSGKWAAEDCSKEKPYICEYTFCSGQMVNLDGVVDSGSTKSDATISNETYEDDKAAGGDQAAGGESAGGESAYVNDGDQANDNGEYGPASNGETSATTAAPANTAATAAPATTASATVDIDVVNEESVIDAAASAAATPATADATTAAPTAATAAPTNAPAAPPTALPLPDGTSDEENKSDEQEREEEEEEQEEKEDEEEDEENDVRDGEARSAERSGMNKLLSLILRHISDSHRYQCPVLPSGENGDWTCNAAPPGSASTSWICILGCAPGWRVVGDGVVGADSGDGVIFCNDGRWSRDDFYCSQSL